jgi:hypothetical protein
MATRKPRPPELPAKPNSRPYYEPILVMAILMGRSVRIAAEMAGIAERTAKRRLATPEMQRALAEARADAFGYVSEGLKQASMRAVATLSDVMADAPVVDERCSRDSHWTPEKGRGRCRCSDGAPAAARVSAASRVLELTMGRRYEVASTVTVTTEQSPAEKMEAFLAKLATNAARATEAIEASYTEETPDDEDHPAPPDVAPPPADGLGPDGVPDPPPPAT